METERKSFIGTEFKEETKPGSFTARIATLNVIDKDSDVTLPGAFPNGKKVLISSYQHGSWQGGLPVGTGIIKEVGDEVLFEGQFNLDSDIGMEHYKVIKFAPDLQEWSYGFRVKELETNVEWQGQPVSRILKKLVVIEVSPVLQGAGIDTAVLAIKSDNQTPPDKKDEGMTFADETKTVLNAVESLLTRSKSLADLRRQDGRDLSISSKESLTELNTKLSALEAGIKDLLTKEPGKDELTRLNLEFVKILSEMR